MPLSRGDVILTFVANIGQPGGKVRPALVVQSNYNNPRLNETTSTTTSGGLPHAHL